MAWVPQSNRNHFIYGSGDFSKYYWNSSYNSNATFNLCLANCTTLCVGRALENGYPKPVTVIRNANLWHTVVNTSEGWTLLNYTSGMVLKAGDIVEWVNNNHVATIEEDGTNPNQSSSWYTGDDGTGGSSRSASVIGGNTLQDVSNFMVNNYPYRFYHYTALSVENQQGGGNRAPDYVLRYDGEEPPTPPTPTTSLIPFFKKKRFTIIKRRR